MDEWIVIETETETQIIFDTAQGLPGASGGGGGASVSSAPIGEAISGHLVLVLIDGILYKADPTNAAHAGKVCGISSQSSPTIGATIEYVPLGDLDSFGITLTVGASYYVGLSGVPSTTQKAVGAVWYQYIGQGKTTSAMFVDRRDAIVIG